MTDSHAPPSLPPPTGAHYLIDAETNWRRFGMNPSEEAPPPLPRPPLSSTSDDCAGPSSLPPHGPPQRPPPPRPPRRPPNVYRAMWFQGNVALPLEQYPWFHGNLKPEEVELRLNSEIDGSYLIYQNSNNIHILSLRCNGRSYHYSIQTKSSCFFIKPGLKFDNLVELVLYYCENTDELEIALRCPVPNSQKTLPLGRWEVSRSQLHVSSKIVGSSSLTETYKAVMKRETALDVAIETVKPNLISDQSHFLRIAHIMECARDHPNVVQLLGVCTDVHPFYLITEFMPRGNLKNFLRGEGSTLEIATRVYMARQICSAMVYLNSRNIVHRSIMAANCLLAGHYTVKLSGFIFSLDITDEEFLFSLNREFRTRMPIKWTAPEVLREDILFSEGSDVWSYGILLWELATFGRFPYPGMKNIEVMELIKGKKYHMPCPDGCPAPLYELMRHCWESDPDDRPTFKEILVTLKSFAFAPDKEDERRHKVCEKVLKAKSLITIIAVIFNYLGLPRSGKTSFRRRITGEIENILKARQQGEVEQPSTGIVEDGGQVLIKPSCLEMGTIRSKIWSAIKDLGDEANMLNQFFHQIAPDGYVEDETHHSIDVLDEPLETSASVTTDTPSNKSKPSFWRRLFKKRPQKSKASVASDEKVSQNLLPSGGNDDQMPSKASSPVDTPPSADDADEMFSIIREAMATDQWEEVKYLLEDTILLVNNDTGGHAEFLDLQAALVQGPSFNLLFSRLVDDMDSLFKIYYTNEEGKSTDKEDSTMTVEEVLYQALSSIACFSGAFTNEEDTPLEETEQSQSKAMFIGTHLDMVSEEEFKSKDEHLRKKIESTEFFKKGIVEYASEDQLMLAVNNFSGDEIEIKGIQEILEKVIKKNFLKISIPAAWLVLSLYLRRKKLRTISLKECEELAGKLGINPEELQDALWFLHHRVGVLLYYPKVGAMKDTVICQMQVVFDSASNLIRNTFTFDRVGKYVSKEFREKGQFSLKDVKKAASGHTDSLIPLEKLVMLLQHLNVLTPIPPSPSSEDSPHTPEPTYFMPCVLQSARASELKVTTSSEDPAPLMLRYECGYVPVGVFPALITNLVSQQREGWKLIQKGLYKNRIQFRVGENYDTLTLISRHRYFELSLSQNEDYGTPISASLCAQVRGVIQSTLSTVTSRMNYHFKMGYKFGFECPTHPGGEHLCVMASENAKLMECLENPEDVKPVRLEPRHKVWFAKNTDALPFSHPSKASAQELTLSLKTLSILKWRDEFGCTQSLRLANEVSAQWKEMGTMLGLTLNDLKALERQHQGSVLDIWKEVMSHWLAGGGGCDYPPTWEGLQVLLNDMELTELGRKLEKAVADSF